MGAVFLIVLLGAVVAWFVKPSPAKGETWDEVEPPDLDQLEAAEADLRSSEEPRDRTEPGFDDDDWGPGASQRSTR